MSHAAGQRVRVVSGAPWAIGAVGTIVSVLDHSCLVEFDEPRPDGDDDGPFVAAAFPGSQLSALGD